MPRPAKITPAMLQRAKTLRNKGHSVADIADELGTSRSRLYAALARQQPAKGCAVPKRIPKRSRPAPPPIDTRAPPAELLRALLENVTATLRELPLDSPRRNPALSAARQLAKAMVALPRQPSPEELEEQRRRADGETRRRIEEYVLQYERKAAEPRPGAPYGVCIHCDAPLTAEYAERVRASLSAEKA